MPQVYSGVFPEHQEADKDLALFIYGMQVYKEDNSIDNRNNDTITPKQSLAKIEKEMRMSPQKYNVVVCGYLRYFCTKQNPNTGFQYMLPIVLAFILRDYKYKENTKKILGWAIGHYYGFHFITAHLEEVHKARRFYDDSYFRDIKEILKPSKWYIYLFKNNFLKKEFLLWLIKDFGWGVPTDEQIIKHQSELCDKGLGVCKTRGYKLKIVDALAHNNLALYHLLCYHLLSEQRMRTKPPATLPEISKQQNAIRRKISNKEQLLLLYSNYYWSAFNAQRYTPGGDVRADLLKAEQLLLRKYALKRRKRALRQHKRMLLQRERAFARRNSLFLLFTLSMLSIILKKFYSQLIGYLKSNLLDLVASRLEAKSKNLQYRLYSEHWASTMEKMSIDTSNSSELSLFPPISITFR